MTDEDFSVLQQIQLAFILLGDMSVEIASCFTHAQLGINNLATVITR